MQQPDKRNALLHHHTDAPSPSDGKCDPDEAAPLHQGLPQQCGLDGTTPIHQGLAPWCGHDITAPLHRRLQPEILEQVQNLHKFHLPHFWSITSIFLLARSCGLFLLLWPVVRSIVLDAGLQVHWNKCSKGRCTVRITVRSSTTSPDMRYFNRQQRVCCAKK